MITHVGNFAINHGVIIFVISLLLFLGRSLDKFVKKSSRFLFARDFLSAKNFCYVSAARVSLEGLDNVFKTKKIFGLMIPKISRLYVVSILISSVILVYYLVISSNNYQLVGLVGPGELVISSALVFDTENGSEFISLLLIPLLIFIANPILDFFSYTQTRFLLKKLIETLESGKYNNLIVIALFCMVDVFYSFALFVLFIYTARRIFYSYVFDSSGSSIPLEFDLMQTLEFAATEPFDLIGSYFSSLGVDGLYGGILLSTFISTLFVWYVYLSYLVGVVQVFFSKALNFLSRHTYILRAFYKKPFAIVSYFFAGIALFFDVALSFFW